MYASDAVVYSEYSAEVGSQLGETPGIEPVASFGARVEEEKSDEANEHTDQSAGVSANHWALRRNFQRILAAYYGYVVYGMNDSSVGVLLPTLEQFYNQSYLVVSLVFLASFCGYLAAATASDMVHRRIGRWGVSVLGTSLQLACYIMCVARPPFAVYAIGYMVAGLGSGLLEAAWNTFLGGLDRPNEVVSILHACYGLGGILCPTIFTAILATGTRWSLCYAVLIGLSVVSVVASALSFWGDTGTAYLQHSQDDVHNIHNVHTGRPRTATMETMRTPLVWMLSVVLFLYVGGMVGIGGWITTFMIVVRHGNQFKMGYVTTGFWAGLTVGRVCLGFVTGYFQHEEHFVTGYASVAVVFLLVFSLVPSVTVSAVSVAFVGVFIGPLFPTIVVVALHKLPKYLHVSGVGFVAAVGGTGAALLPFVNGVLSDRFGPKVLGPYALVLIGGMLVAWLCVVKFF